MEGEIHEFIKVWISVLVSLSYCYVLSKITSKGVKRFLWVLPVIFIFLLLPLKLNSVHLGGSTAFFITWLANFKLLLFVFGKGPLCSDPSISFTSFLAVACLPIKIQQNPHTENPFRTSNSNGQNKENPSPISNLKDENTENPVPKNPKTGPISPLNYSIKGLFFALLFCAFNYNDYLHPQIILFLYCIHIYFVLEIILAIAAFMARILLGLELEPQFNEPYLSTSLQDFWGSRWNLMVTRILRPTIYEPILSVSNRIISRPWAPIPAISATFMVSGFKHELIFYYLGRIKPTWEIAFFFLVHGFCLVIEIILKRLFNEKFRLPKFISGPLTVLFVFTTVFWLFFPQFLRCKADIRGFEEYTAVSDFFKTLVSKFWLPNK